MKTKLTMLSVFLMAAVTFTQAQSKKDVEADLAKTKADLETCTTNKDSIQNVLAGLSTQYDSINTAYLAYDTMYRAVKEKVLLYDFDPLNMSELIDSLRTGRDEAFAGMSDTMNDSIAILVEENTKLKELIESMGEKGDQDSEVVKDLKQLKELLDTEIITQEEFDTKKSALLEKL